MTPVPGQPLLQACWAALERTRDPELDISLVALGLIRDLAVEDSAARVRLTFTSMGCPWTDWIKDGIRDELLRVPGIHDVSIEVVWDHPWTPRHLRPDARRRLGEIGIAV